MASTRRIRFERRWRAATARCGRWTCTTRAAAATCCGGVCRRPRRRARRGAPRRRRMAKGTAVASRWASRTAGSSSWTSEVRDGTRCRGTATRVPPSQRSGSDARATAAPVALTSFGRWARVGFGGGAPSRCRRTGGRGKAPATRPGAGPAGSSRTSPTPSRVDSLRHRLPSRLRSSGSNRATPGHPIFIPSLHPGWRSGGTTAA